MFKTVAVAGEMGPAVHARVAGRASKRHLESSADWHAALLEEFDEACHAVRYHHRPIGQVIVHHQSSSSHIGSTDPDFTVRRRLVTTDSRKSASAGCVEGHEVTRSQGQEVKVAVASSEHDTQGSRVMTSWRRKSRRSARYYRSGRPKLRHVTESPAVMTTSRHLRESRGVTSSSSIVQGPRVVTSSDNVKGPRDVPSSATSREPRGRSPCKYHHRNHRGSESPTMTSSSKPRDSPRDPGSTSGRHRRDFESAEDSCQKMATVKKPEHCRYVRSVSVPPSSGMTPNPFSPFWNFLFTDSRPTEDVEDHVCNTVRSPSTSWFGSTAVITNIYLFTVNRWTGIWPTLASQLAARDCRRTNSDVKDTVISPSLESQCAHSHSTADTRQVGTS